MQRSNTCNFLFTDIEGSTRRWESDRAAMSAALARHDAILRTAIENHAGTVFKTVGDAYCAVFNSAADAAATAIAAQRELAAVDWGTFGQGFTELRVRMAIHAGEAEQRDGDWFGPPLNRVARLLAAGHGGQVLVSQAAQALIGEQMDKGVLLHDLGTHRLKDLHKPERVFQLSAPGLASSFPALVSLDARPNNLPAQLDSFVGRSEEMAQLHAMLGDPAGPRLVTLTGTGGTGKTRLAVQAAADLVDRFEHGAWLVELAPLASGAAIGPAIVLSLGLRDEPARDPIESLAGQIADRRLLLLLDNCEHLVDSVADLTFRLLRTCPSLRILATSREALSVTGERCLPLGPLPSPRLGSRRVEVVGQSEAVRLFVDRARSARPNFQLDAANAPAIAELCHRLDGIPLALELAAARVRTLAPEQINARLGDRLRFLTGGSRDRPNRQQTLRATIDWSFDLLLPAEQSVFARLSAITGTFPIELVEALCCDTATDAFDILDSIESLANRSLIVPIDVDGSTWYRLLESLRVYAAEKLVAAGDTRAVHRRHLAWYRARIDLADIQVFGPDCDAWTTRLRPLAADLECAVRRALETPDDEDLALDLIEAGWWLFINWGGLIFGQRLLDLLLPSLQRIEAQQPGDDGRPMLRWLIGVVGLWTGRQDEALLCFEAAARGFHRLGDRRHESWAIQEAGAALRDLGRLDDAEACFQAALQLKRQLDDPVDVCLTLLNLSDLYRRRAASREAAAVCQDAFSLLSDTDRRSSLGTWVLLPLAQCHLRLGEPALARQYWQALMRLEITDELVVASSLAGLAAQAIGEEQPEIAARLLGAAEAAFEALNRDSGLMFAPTDADDWSVNTELVRASIAPLGLLEAIDEGAAMDRSDVLALARALLDGTPFTVAPRAS